MKKINPEKKLSCRKCIFCVTDIPICGAMTPPYPISAMQYYSRPSWCPFSSAGRIVNGYVPPF